MKKSLGISIGILVVLLGSIFYIMNNGHKENKLFGNQAANSVSNQRNKQQSFGKGTAQNKQQDIQTADQIVQKYQPQFQEINTLAEKRDENLLKQAKKEVTDKKDKHQNINDIQVKYDGIFDHYEQNMQIQFNSAYKQLQDEVVKNKLPITLITGFKDEYQVKKEERNQKFQQEFKKFI